MNKTIAPILALTLALAALPALAHEGHAAASGLAAGLAHPFLGLDHLLAMLGIGVWSRRQEQPLALPVTFLAMMAAGALLQGGFVVAEVWVLASVVTVGLLLSAVRMPEWGAIALVGLFGLLHGQVHGHELPGLSSAAGYLVASAALLLAGYRFGPRRAPEWTRCRLSTYSSSAPRSKTGA